MENEFKFSGMRQFGSESISFSATIHSPIAVLSQEDIDAQIDQFSKVVTSAFKAAQEREISEKDLLVAASERRTAAVKKLDEALKLEMKQSDESKRTLKEAERKGGAPVGNRSTQK